MKYRDRTHGIVQDKPGRPTNLKRRRFLSTAGIGAAALEFPFLLSGRAAYAADDDAPPDLDAARKEGPLHLWHGDQEGDVVKFVKAFTEKTGIEVLEQRILPGAAWPKLNAQLRTGRVDADVYDTSDVGTMDQMRKQGHLLRYRSKELDAYEGRFLSNPQGFWATYFINVGPIMYDPRYVKEDEAPQSLMDLLDPRWKGQIGFQNTAAGTSYAMWYVLKDVLPKDYWDKLAAQEPKGYASSTQIMSDLHRGDIKLGGRVSIFQYLKSKRDNLPIKMVFPPEGAASVNEVTAIFATTKRPNAAKAYIDYLLSQEGQQKWNEIQGSYSARPDATVEGLPPISDIKILIPSPDEYEEYGSQKLHAEYVKVWNKMIGL